jgi:hypothetical protein
MEVGDRVRWTQGHEGTWGWPGLAKIVSYDPNRKYFEGNRVPKGEVCHGPACQIVLEHNSLSAWVSPLELDEIQESENDETDS